MLKKIGLSLALLAVLVLSGFTAFVFLARPKMRPAPVLSASATPERLARGEYLGQGCLDCRSKRDFKRYAGPIVPPLGAHGDCFDKGIGVPAWSARRTSLRTPRPASARGRTARSSAPCARGFRRTGGRFSP